MNHANACERSEQDEIGATMPTSHLSFDMLDSRNVLGTVPFRYAYETGLCDIDATSRTI
jgi:hypothetical protein